MHKLTVKFPCYLYVARRTLSSKLRDENNYVHDYYLRVAVKINYALNNLCFRVWGNPQICQYSYKQA